MLKSITLEVVGDQRLHCASCEQRVERLLKAVPGIRQVRAEARDQRIDVLFDTAVLEAAAIAARLVEAGYETRIGHATSKEIRPRVSANTTSSARRNWLRSLALLPGALLPLLPNATCPACVAAYAGVISALGLGFLLTERYLAPLIVAFLLIGIASVAWSTRSHRRAGPLIATLLGSAAVIMGRVAGHEHLLLYSGVSVLIAASLWNLWLKRRQPQQLIRIAGAQDQ
jgi:copper chaperone